MKGFLLASLLCCVFYPLTLLTAWADQGASETEVSCEENVDAVDDINFSDNIIECDEDAVVTYDQSSRQKFLKHRVLSQQTFGNQPRDETNTAVDEKPVHLLGTTFIIRAAYQLESPQLALVSLHQQMARYCPKGWELNRQWSSPQASDYYLHYEFTCAEPV